MQRKTRLLINLTLETQIYSAKKLNKSRHT